MTTIYKFITIFLIMCQSCNQTPNHRSIDEPIERANQHIIKNEYESQDSLPTEDSVKKEYEIMINCDEETKILSKINYINVDKSISAFRPLVLHQQLDFYIKNKLIKSVTFPFNTSKIQLNEEVIKVQNTTICDIECLKNEKGELIYKLYGSNNFDPPHEFFGLISKRGEWLWYYYGDRYDVYKKHGDEKVYIEEYGESQINNLGYMQEVCPFL